MPIYEFECTCCGDVFDRLQKLSDPDPTTCPVCGKAGIKRRLTAPAFRLAGSGWYETDFKKDSDRKRNLAGGDDGPKADAREAKPIESKTEATPANKDAGKSAATTDSKPASTKPKADGATPG